MIEGKQKFFSVNKEKEINRNNIWMKKLYFYESPPSGFSHESNRFDCKRLLTGLKAQDVIY
jgi:hypothetical protein